MSIEALRAFLRRLPAGRIEDTRELAPLLAACWAEIDAEAEDAMYPELSAKRWYETWTPPNLALLLAACGSEESPFSARRHASYITHAVWQSPLLTFATGRTDTTAKGAVTACHLAWEVNVEKQTARLTPCESTIPAADHAAGLPATAVRQDCRMHERGISGPPCLGQTDVLMAAQTRQREEERARAMSIEVLRRLLIGVDPADGGPLCPACPVNRPDVIRAVSLALRELERSGRSYSQVERGVGVKKLVPEPSPLDDDSLMLYDILRAWRNRVAIAKTTPPYAVVYNRTLKEIARVRPTTLEDLQRIPGIGRAKLGNYGADILSIVQGFSEQRLSATRAASSSLSPAESASSPSIPRPREGAPWSAEEDKHLTDLCSARYDLPLLAGHFGRGPLAVADRLKELGLADWHKE